MRYLRTLWHRVLFTMPMAVYILRTAVPPALMNGSGIPMTGMTLSTMPIFMKAWAKSMANVPMQMNLGFARAADVIEKNALCLFGTGDFTRGVASRMSNLSLATNPSSKILSADSLLVPPDETMLLVHLVLPDETIPVERVPRVCFNPEGTLALRLVPAINAAYRKKNPRIVIELPGAVWEDAGEARSMQHYAISLLDALCSALERR